MKKLVLIVGAGATVADVMGKSKRKRPPLDKNFFSVSRTSHPKITRQISNYINDKYGIDIFDPQHDSLERAMAIIYTDMYNPSIESEATETFHRLIGLFNRRLAETTNMLSPNKRRYLYKIIIKYLEKGINPSELAIITFNQDLQIEKILSIIEKTKRWATKGRIFNFPYCYNIQIDKNNITSPSGGGSNLFREGDHNKPCLMILKLHGSLNWYSIHNSSTPSTRAMFKKDRRLYITTRQKIDPEMKLAREHRKSSTLPVIIPPVTHKSGILHKNMGKLWSGAEQFLKEAEEIVIFGYSCPAQDFESSNLIQRSIKANRKYKLLSIIDTDANVITRYADLIKPKGLTYYSSAETFISSRR